MALVKAIRLQAYPKHPSESLTMPARSPATKPANKPAAIPIFVMRPLLGYLEHATQNAVGRLRAEGDKSVFWLDTSGWLDLEDTESDDRDFSLEDVAGALQWRLTERGNQRVTIFLHMHVCRFLAADAERCPFLPPDVYEGAVFDPDSAGLDRYLQMEKEKKLKAAFWKDI